MARRTHLGEEAVGFAKLSLVGSVVAGEAGEVGSLFVDERFLTPASGLLDKALDIPESGPDVVSHGCALGTEMDARSDEMCHTLEVLGSASLCGDDRLVHGCARPAVIAQTEIGFCQDSQHLGFSLEARARPASYLQPSPERFRSLAPLVGEHVS